jgi:uncharacterized membrane protein YGL010W
VGRGAFNVSNIVQLVEGGCGRNKVTMPLGRGAFNVCNIVQLVEGGFERNKVPMFVDDLRHDGGFLRALRFPPPIKLTAMI